MDARLRDFIAEIGNGLGDARRLSRVTEYVQALLIESPEPKSFAQLARLLTEDEDERYRLEQSFQHLVNGSSWEPDDLLQPAAKRIAEEIDVKAMMLLAVVFPRLGEHVPQYPDRRDGGHQLAAVLQMVGVDRNGDPAILPFRWRLSLEEERWQSMAARERAEVDYPVGVHISVHGRRILSALNEWDLPRVPLVAAPSYGWLRAHWLREDSLQNRAWRYVVELPERADWDSRQQLETLLATRPDEPVLQESVAEIDATPLGHWQFYSLRGDMGNERVVVRESEGAGEELPRARAWCTNFAATSEGEQRQLIALARLRHNSRAFWDELRYGLLGAAGYRGLSVKGWERHCALVTLAQAYRIHAGIPEPPGAALQLPAGYSRPKEGSDWRSAMRESQVLKG